MFIALTHSLTMLPNLFYLALLSHSLIHPKKIYTHYSPIHVISIIMEQSFITTTLFLLNWWLFYYYQSIYLFNMNLFQISDVQFNSTQSYNHVTWCNNFDQSYHYSFIFLNLKYELTFQIIWFVIKILILKKNLGGGIGLGGQQHWELGQDSWLEADICQLPSSDVWGHRGYCVKKNKLEI